MVRQSTASARQPLATNKAIANAFDRVAALLSAQHANLFRVRAYRHGADVIRAMGEPIAYKLQAEGRESLERLEGIGKQLAVAVEEIVHTGRLAYLDRLEGQVSPEERFATIPGIGEQLAHQIHTELHIDTLEGLEAAAVDGRLAKVSGFGPTRVFAVREYLRAMFEREARRRTRRRRVDLGTLLDLDHEYRSLAEKGSLPKIAPRRFNPKGRVWLPIWHTERRNWSFTVLFSNSGLAHQLGKTQEWVVVHFERDGVHEQETIVTEWRGELRGRRVVRGREDECRRYYRRPVDPEVRRWIHQVAEDEAA